MNETSLLCAANQISKSSTNIRKCIHWSTEKNLWPELWRTVPRNFWYMYPSKQLATQEFETKWVPEFMPRGEMEKHPKYGWKAKYKNGELDKIQWNNGLPVYFKTYSQITGHSVKSTCKNGSVLAYSVYNGFNNVF